MGKNKNKNKNKPAEAAPEASTDAATPEAEDAPMEEKVTEVKIEENVEEKSDVSEKKESESTASNDAKEESKKSDEVISDTSSNDGVKILEEVFGKASVEETPKSEAPATPAAAASFGPEPPKENEYPEDDLKKAEEFKTQGNNFFKDNKFEEAIEQYSEAIFCNVSPSKKAIYYCNRALVSIKTENYALALFDAKDAIKQDPTNVKAYYRLGSANLAMNKYDVAIEQFKTVCKMQPQNKDARQKYEDTLKEHKLRLFQSALNYGDQRVDIKIEDIQVESSYTGPKLDKSTDEINPEWVKSLMQYQKDRKVLHKRYACMIIQKAKEIFEKDKSLVDITRGDEEEITVCGDIHGQYYDLLNIFEINGIPSKENPYLFNGDFIDRGSFSVEVIMTLLSWKVCYPKHFFMSRGNHETKNLNKLYGFEGEVKHKYDIKVYELFNEMFCHMPLSHCINKKVFVTHGGLFAKDGVKLEDIRKTNRNKEPGDEGIMCECLWSDPCDMNGRHPSKRGVGVMFGPDVTEKFLQDNDLKLVVRSHEVKPSGYEYQKGGKCLTIFSAPNYCDQMGNKGAFIRFKGKTMEPEITPFEKVDHPKIPPMAYASGFGGLF